MRKLFLITLLSLSLFGSELDDKNFREIVVGYNHGFLLANKKNTFEHLQEYLTQEIYYRTRIWIESYHDSYLFMDAKLVGIKFGEFKQDGITATLDTSEKWQYRYIDMRSRKVVSEPTKTDYKMRYYFIELENGSWKINHIKILNEKSTPLKAPK